MSRQRAPRERRVRHPFERSAPGGSHPPPPPTLPSTLPAPRPPTPPASPAAAGAAAMTTNETLQNSCRRSDVERRSSA